MGVIAQPGECGANASKSAIIGHRNLIDFCYLCFVISRSIGAIAQLGERLNGIQEVSGSIPLSSTKKSRSNSGFFILKNLN